eukprot:315037-Prymnesium_polylepis.1
MRDETTNDELQRGGAAIAPEKAALSYRAEVDKHLVGSGVLAQLVPQIPREATRYAFGYPLQKASAILGKYWKDETDAREVAIRCGFFIFWDKDNLVCAVHALAQVTHKLMLKVLADRPELLSKWQSNSLEIGYQLNGPFFLHEKSEFTSVRHTLKEEAEPKPKGETRLLMPQDWLREGATLIFRLARSNPHTRKP